MVSGVTDWLLEKKQLICADPPLLSQRSAICWEGWLFLIPAAKW